MTNWEGYWQNVFEQGSEGMVFWDAVPEHAALEDIRRFKDYMTPGLPLLDLGCGNGRQTRLLSTYFPQVVGVDISPSAVELARSETVDETNIEYRVMDAVDTESARELHAEFGDMNIYMRGVLHMIKWHDRPKFVDSLAVLLGETGVLYQIELPLEAFRYWRTLPEDMWTLVPKITPRVGFNLRDRPRFFPDDEWAVLEQSRDVKIRTIPLSHGKKANVPANYLIMTRKNSSFPDS